MDPIPVKAEGDKPIPLRTGKIYRIEVPGKTLTVVLLGADGRTPLVGKRVELEGPGTASSQRTDAQGRVVFDKLQPGSYAVRTPELDVLEVDNPPTGAAPTREVRLQPGNAPVKLQAARVPVVFVHGVFGSEVYVKHGGHTLEVWPNVGQLALSADPGADAHWMQSRVRGDRHLYLLALAAHATHPDGQAAERLRRLQRSGLADLYAAKGLGTPGPGAFTVEIGDLVQDVKRTMSWLLQRHFQNQGADLDQWHYGPMVKALETDLGYKVYLRPGATAPLLAADRKPPATPPAGVPEDLFFFPYDWRQSPDTVATELAGFVANVKAYTGRPKVHLVTHSLGTLVGRCYAKSHADSIERLVLAGGPHLGSAETLGAALTGHRVDDGTDTLFYDPALRYLACTLPCTYVLFPRWPKAQGPQLQVFDKGSNTLRKAEGAAAAGQVNDELRQLVESCVTGAALPDVRPNAALWQAADRLFTSTLGTHPPPAGKTIVIYEDEFTQTNKALYYELDTAAKTLQDDDSKIIHTGGDGTVPTFSAMPWGPEQVLLAHVVKERMGHGGLYNSKEVQDLLKKELLGQGAAPPGSGAGD